MKKIYVADTTLGDSCGGLPVVLSFKEKLEIAKSLDKLGVNVVELGAVGDEKIDSLLVRTIASFVKSAVISVSAGASESEVETAYRAVSSAAHPRLTVSLPVSPSLMEYGSHIKPADLPDLVSRLVGKAKSLCPDVEFRAVDATHAEAEVLYAAVNAAIAAGAETVTVCDSEGSSFPEETRAFFDALYAAVPALKDVRLGFMCENNLNLGLSSVITALRCGAEEVKLAAGCPSAVPFESFAEFLETRGDGLKLSTTVSQTEVLRLLNQIRWIASAKKNEHSALDKLTLVSSPEEISLTAGDDIKAVNKVVKKLGYDLSDEDKTKVFEEFRRVAVKKNVTARELDVIVASVAMQIPEAYKLVSYVINSGNLLTASANITLEKGGEKLQGISLGDGPIDAAFLTIEQIVGRHYEVDDFQIQAVTEGREAMGSAMVKLRSGKLYSGTGLSTDIIGAAIRAYLSALNKIIYEEA